MNLKDLKKNNLPDKPGIYFFMKGKNILYIGKATSLSDRTKSYFSKDLIATRGPMILDMVMQADNLDWQETDSVLEALILEAELIKKYQPKYNTKEKSDKSFNYVCITKEKIPKVVIERGRNLQKQNFSSVFGPYTNGSQLREAMKIVRRIFPYLDVKSKSNFEFYKQLQLVPENIEFYKKNIKNLKLFFKGKKKKILINLKKEMKTFAKKYQFEKAGEIKRQIFALQHIQDVSLIKDEKEFFLEGLSQAGEPRVSAGSVDPDSDPIKRDSLDFLYRIEAYDISHLSGKNMVGVMTVVEDGEINKKEYKKFIVKTQNGANDTGALTEIISRRLKHSEWKMPNLIVVDGSTAQINVAQKILNDFKLKIPVVGVVKNDKHKVKAIIGNEKIVKQYKKDILLANSESHRFAIAFHRQKFKESLKLE